MNPTEFDKLMQQVAELETSTGQQPSREILDAYRSRSLPPEDREHLDHLLAHNPRARQILLEAAGLPTEGPSPALRQRALAAFPAPDARAFSWPKWLAAAVVLATASWLLIFGSRDAELRPFVDSETYDVKIYGIAKSRSTPDATEPLEAYADSVIRIEIAARKAAQSEVEFGIYHQRGNQLLRVVRADSDSLEASKGAVIIRAQAEDLVGSRLGNQVLFITVARLGDLPASIELQPADSAFERLAANDRRRVYPQHILLLASGDSGISDPVHD